MQDTKKFGCLAQVKMKEIFLFPAFKVCLFFTCIEKIIYSIRIFLCEGYFRNWSSLIGILIKSRDAPIEKVQEMGEMLDLEEESVNISDAENENENKTFDQYLVKPLPNEEV